MPGLKCPICYRPMKEQADGTCMSYQETDCICNIAAPKILWEEMAALRKKRNIYTKTCRMEKEFAEEELERTKKKLDIAVEELTKIKTAAESVGIGFFMTAAISALAKINNVEQFNSKDE